VTVPCCDVIRIRGKLICEQRAYLDQTPVWAECAEDIPFRASVARVAESA
jgi:hypothetical protein